MCYIIMDDLSKKIPKINSLCEQLNAGLFLADAFNPKPIPVNAPIEMRFWYDVTNINALFVDCMPYLFRKCTRYKNYSYTLDITRINETKTLLSIMEARGAITQDKSKALLRYINAIRELRSCFCHNKLETTLNRNKVEMGLGKHRHSWSVFPHLQRGSSDPFDYEMAGQMLAVVTEEMLNVIENAIEIMSQTATDEDIYDWSQSIAAWYLESDDIISRCLITYYRLKRVGTSMGAQLFQWNQKLKNDSLKAIAKARGVTLDNFLCDSLRDLTDSICDSHIVAKPEYIMPDFFDSII